MLNAWSVVDCTITDVSDTGAKLAFAGFTSLPKTFRLRFNISRMEALAELVWQRGLAAGVRFAVAPRA